MLLSGYSVELAIKSTEYKAVDDTKVKGLFVTNYTSCSESSHHYRNLNWKPCSIDSKSAANNTEDDSNEDVQGFFFGTLK